MLRSTILVTLLSVVGNAVSLLNQLVLARFFGAGPELDAYLVGISLPLTISSLLAGVLAYQLVPALQRASVGRDSSDGLLGTLVLGLGGGLLLLGIIGSAFAGIIAAKTLTVSAWQDRSLIIDIARISWLWIPLAVVGAVYTAGLHLRQRFFVATLFQSLPTLGALCGCLVAHNRIGVRALVWGQLAGYVVMIVGLRIAIRLSPARLLDWKGFRRLMIQMPLALSSLMIFFIYPFSDAIWGAKAGPSGVSHLGYAQRLLVGFAGLTVVGATTVLFPRFAIQAAAGDSAALRLNLSKGIRVILLLVVPAAVLLGVLALPALQLLFQRGAFRLADAVALSKLLPSMFAGMVAMSCAGVVYKALFAQGAVGAAATLGLIGAAIYFCLSGVLVRPFGLPGIGVSYAIAWWTTLWFGIRQLWRMKNTNEPPILSGKFMFRLAAASSMVGLICWIGTYFLPPAASDDKTTRFAVFAGTSLFATVFYLIAGNTFLATEELCTLTRHFRNMFNRR